ncbi:MAG TPA: hypothetical protein VIM81_11535 [Gammaproteobacteria bacterium]
MSCEVDVIVGRGLAGTGEILGDDAVSAVRVKDVGSGEQFALRGR